MTSKRVSLDANDLIRRYKEGESAPSLAKASGVSLPTITRRLKAGGVKIRNGALDVDAALIVRRYLSGASEKQLADELGISRCVIARRLAQANVERRGRSEAERAKWSLLKKSRPAVERQCRAAWDAVRGSSKPAGAAAKMASSKSRVIGRHEREVMDTISRIGYAPTDQFPYGPYNIDIAIEEARFAVEVVGCALGRKALRRLPQRTKYLLDGGWAVLFLYVGPLWGGKRVTPDWAHVRKELVTLLDRARRNESVHGRYRVVRGDGKATTMFRRYLDHLPVIEGPVSTIE